MRAWAGAAVLATLACTAAGCVTERDFALDRAITSVHEMVESDLTGIGSAVSQGSDRDRLVAAHGPKIFDSRPLDGGFELDMVVYGHGEAGGGWTYEQVKVRTCVRVLVRRDRSPAAEASALECPPGLPTRVDGYGDIDQTVEFDPKTASR
ncbi:hypothetical protein OG205_37345 [Lentzea sp. NBC_00516]|uniref:hypothetical protein n=1 Tax=Lentzea sp. NBC_00516 TaxID=2903582 RepID=UPI002E805670|nr:hypothetical protein [Lentzea sp. NBC_00516]WUD23665.1 hypothetical protein OG205_37345 [Lentzea sp. NBC_00516]